jgi:hypothetical protein
MVDEVVAGIKENEVGNTHPIPTLSEGNNEDQGRNEAVVTVLA